MVPLEIRLNVFRQSTIPKKQFIIIIIVPKNIIKMIKKIERERERERERAKNKYRELSEEVKIKKKRIW